MHESAQVALAPVTAEDLPFLFSWINDRETVLRNAPYKPVHAGAHRQWFESVRQRTDVALFAIRLLADDSLIGTCQLINMHTIHRNAELQIRIGVAQQRGKGYGGEATRLLLNHAFKDLNLHRVGLHVFADNAAALRMYEKAGMRREGVLREAAHIDGRYVDVVEMGILRSEHLYA